MKRITRITILILSIFVFENTFAAETIARVAKATGDVFVKRLGSGQYNEAVSAGAAINNGDAMKVGDTGFAVVIFINDRSVVKVKNNTEFQFVDTENTRTIDIDTGTIINQVTKQEKGKTFRVETPTSVASVKGTIFSAVVDPSGVDQFYGTEGIVEVFNVVSGQSVNLTAGTKTISNALGSLVQAPAAPNEYPTDPETGQPPAPESEAQPEGGQPEQAPTEEATPPPEETPAAPSEEAPTTQPEQTPPAPPEETPAAPEEGGGGAGESPFGMGLGIGSVTIDGKIYNQFAFRPELKFGKLAVGFDLVLYLDSDGNFRKDEWDFKNNPSQILDKVLYIRWGQKGDPIWAKWGSLENVTLGYGGLVSGYSNMMEFPTVRRLGINAGIQKKNIGAELFMNNIKDLARGGTLLGMRGTYRVSKNFPLTVGINFVADLNQFSGMADRDGDSYPDIFDKFPDKKVYWQDTDGDGLADQDPAETDRDGDGLPDVAGPDVKAYWQQLEHSTGADFSQYYNTIPDDSTTLKPDPFSIKNNKAAAYGFGADIGYPVFSNKFVSLTAYTELNMLTFPAVSGNIFNRPARSGMGITVPGLQMTILKFIHASFEYRIKQNYFVPQFFDQSYDLTRVIASYPNDIADIQTKDMTLFGDPLSKTNTKGYYGMASADLLNIASFGAAYTNMKADTIEFNSFYAQVSLNADLVPKLSVASAYYVRNNDANPFDFGNPSENTVLGYRLGYEVSDGVSLIWNFSQYYRDDGTGIKPIRQTTIETAFDL